MSISRICSVHCDQSGCGAWIGEEFSVAEARKVARHYKWEMSRLGDFCAAHRLGGPLPACGKDGALLVKEAGTDRYLICTYCRTSVPVETIPAPCAPGGAGTKE